MIFADVLVTTPAAVLPVTVEEFVEHGRLNGITVQVQPELLTRELTAATSKGEAWCRRSFIQQELSGMFLPWDAALETSMYIRLPRGNVISVDGVELGTGDVIPADGWTYTAPWNVVRLTSPAAGAVVVKWKSGYGPAATDVPAGIRDGILEYALTLYEDRRGTREVKATSDVGSKVPQGVQDLWRPYQIEVSG